MMDDTHTSSSDDCRHTTSRPSGPPTKEAGAARVARLDAAAVVAGRIAHDFNNLLTPLLAYPELVLWK